MAFFSSQVQSYQAHPWEALLSDGDAAVWQDGYSCDAQKSFDTAI
jgi:hypothetical protein